METRNTKIGGCGGRIPAARVLSVLAVAGAVLGSLAQPAAAQILGDPSTPLRMDFTQLRCKEEIGDGIFDLHDEPYVVVFAADISGPVPRAATFRSQIFGNVDSGETHFATQATPVWNLDGTGSPILNPDHVIFLCALMESDQDSWRADRVRDEVQSDLLPKLLGYKVQGLDRKTIVGKLANDMRKAINAARYHDDTLASVTEIRLTMDDILRARTGPWVPVTKTVQFSEIGTNPPWYYVSFVLQPSTIIIY